MKNKRRIDLNCDIGESFGPWVMGNDEAILPYVSSVNIACGFHAGDPTTMMQTLALVAPHNLQIGAHPGFHDRQGFGRREIQMSPREVYNSMVYQIGALLGCATACGLSLHHVKPHGALYNMAAKDALLADAIATAVYDVDPSLALYGLSGSEITRAGHEKGLQVYHEVFADRTYRQDGTLTPRGDSSALISDDKQAIEQVLRMVEKGNVLSVDGTSVPIVADTICLHGDNSKAVIFAKLIVDVLHDHNIEIG